MTDSIALWLDCDTGHDDAFAILLAAYHTRANLLGVSTVFGNAALPNTTYNTLAILKAIRKEHIPVYRGSAKPFCRNAAHAADIHGESGLDGTSCLPVPSSREHEEMTAVAAMHQALSQTTPGTAWLVATGCLTNIALLFSIHPDLAQHIRGLSVMGGAVGDSFTDAVLGTVEGHGIRFGNWTPFAEFNIYIDPESAQAIFSNAVLCSKTTLITLDLTHQFLATQNIQQRLLYGSKCVSKSPSQLRKLFHEILTFFSKTYADVFGLEAGPPLHDPLAVAAALDPHLFDDGLDHLFQVKIVTEGAHGSSAAVRNSDSQCGRTIVMPVENQAQQGVRIPRSLRQDELWSMLDDALSRVEA